MNYLHRIVFIHSASITYQEMTLAGNVHITGKNGMGKSSLLRAILFFYTADPLGLGIKPNQAPFAAFYLPSPHSWLVYEVQGKPGPFVVLAFRHQKRVSFYFVSGSYDAELLLDAQGRARDLPGLEAELDRRGLAHTDRIDTYAAYRDILYGTVSGPARTSLRRYSLFEASQHVHVWRTLTHIFLNARLEAGFLKRSLVEASSDAAFSIDLRRIRQALQDFERHRSDILAFRQHEPAAAQLVAASTRLHQQGQRQVALAQALARAFRLAQARREAVAQDLAIQQQARSQLQAARRLRQQQSQDRRDTLLRRLGALQHRQETAHRVDAQVPPMESLRTEMALFTQDDAATTASIASLQAENLRSQLAAYAQAEAQRRAWQAHYEQERASLVAAQRAQREALAAVALALARAEASASPPPTAPPLADIRVAIAEAEAALLRSQQARQDMEAQRDQALAELDAEAAAHQQAGQQQAEALQAQLEALEAKLAQIGHTFYSWLEDRYPDWTQTIGKVVREEVLFHPYLAPQIERLNDLLFGVRLDLTEIETPAFSPAQLEQQRRELAQALEAHLKTFVAEREAAREKRLATEKRYNRQKIRALQRQIEGETHTLAQLQLKARKERLRLQDQQQAATQTQQAQILRLRYDYEAAQQALTAHTQALASCEAAEAAQLRRIETELAETLDLLQARAQALSEPVPGDEEADSSTARADQYAHWPDLIRYECYRTLYRDRLPAIETEIQALTSEIAQVEAQLQAYEATVQRQEARLQETIETATAEAARLTTQLQQVEAFRETSPDLQQALTTSPTEAEAGHEGDDLAALIHLLHQQTREQLIAEAQLRQQLQAFFKHFRPGNVFGFPTSVREATPIATLTQALGDMVEQQKIADYAQDLEAHYAQLAGTLSAEADALDTREAEIKQLVDRINHSLREHNFVGVVKGIELRVTDTQHRVVVALRQLRAFSQAQGYGLGGLSLFNQASDGDRNQEAIALLDSLRAGLVDFPGEALQLEDTFRLEFRVRENQNDTGWVEHLSQAGSHGTDVLVKAMIYITLLSVFKQGASRRQQAFRLHALIDEAGILDAQHLTDLIAFANDRDILLINGAPQVSNPMAYQYLYHLSRDAEDMIRLHRLMQAPPPQDD